MVIKQVFVLDVNVNPLMDLVITKVKVSLSVVAVVTKTSSKVVMVLNMVKEDVN